MKVFAAVAVAAVGLCGGLYVSIIMGRKDVRRAEANRLRNKCLLGLGALFTGTAAYVTIPRMYSRSATFRTGFQCFVVTSLPVAWLATTKLYGFLYKRLPEHEKKDEFSRFYLATRSAMVGLLAGMTVGSLAFAGVYTALSDQPPEAYGAYPTTTVEAQPTLRA
eukprot:RCo002612